ncbi:hypothetical protein GCM10010885_03070 [Alicyclobacillus cellulosilyticus]|uniref:Acetyltransferase (GNAT) family protein n=1 Tax=Alicyclobacillus cellulosilyticus TaxID=1003997 RepID=A0A917K131_9BACL|nr:hypothetical protein GCM10010885_03070 [Alicyclobacillus cellulosilyticus]
MELHRITRIDDPWFADLHALMRRVFPPEEVLAYDAWAKPLADPNLRVMVAVAQGEVVGATEYRYWPDLEIGMIDFTIIAAPGCRWDGCCGRAGWRTWSGGPPESAGACAECSPKCTIRSVSTTTTSAASR